MMTDADKPFDQQIHDAYEGVRLSDEAQDRMLANLLAAQASRAAEEEKPMGERDDESTGEQAPVSLLRPRKLRWQVVLPAAAAIVAVVLAVTLPKLSAPVAVQQANESVAAGEQVDMKSDEFSYMNEREDMALESEAPMMDVEVQEGAGESRAPEEELHAVDYYPAIELPDGTVLTALIDGMDGMTVKEVDPEQVGEYVGEGKAHMNDAATPTVSCTVYRLKGSEDTYAVCYEGEESYWYCRES